MVVATNINNNNNNNLEPPPIRPRKPPRLLQYVHHRSPFPAGKQTVSISILRSSNFTTFLVFFSGTVENTEYFSLPDYNSDSGTNVGINVRSESTPSSNSESYHSDTNETSNSNSTSSPPRRVSYGYHKSPAPPPPIPIANSGFRRALVIYDYNKKTPTEVSLEKSQVVNVLDANPGSEWWRVQDDLGRNGYFPAHYLRMV